MAKPDVKFLFLDRFVMKHPDSNPSTIESVFFSTERFEKFEFEFHYCDSIFKEFENLAVEKKDAFDFPAQSKA